MKSFHYHKNFKKKSQIHKRILIVGGAGYIGSVLTDNLLKNGYSVRSLDLFLYKNNECALNFLGSTNYEFLYGDCTDRSFIKKSLEGVGCVLILAGLVGDPISKKYPKESALINDKGVKNVIDLCAENNIEKLIYVSTCSNYGLIESDDLADEEYALNPLSLYAKTKVNAEKYILSLKGKTGMNPTILRFATAFGLSPRMRFDLTVSEFTRELALGKELLVYDVDTWRPYCHILDFARLIQMVIEAETEIVSFEVFNAGGNINNATKQTVVNTILEQIPDGKVRYKDRGDDPRNYRVSFEKVKLVLGFEPKYTLQYGIEELLNAMNNHVFDNVDENKNFYGNYEIHYPLRS